MVVEGAAGAGKTTALRSAHNVLARQGHRLVVVTPTLKAAEVAAAETGADGHSAAWLIHQHGWRWDDDGHWARRPHATTGPGPVPAARLRPGDLLLVDEAGMLDQDTARALLTIADEAGARVALVGDRHQLPAVGRGGVLDHAVAWAHPTAVVTLEKVHRFTDPDYAALSACGCAPAATPPPSSTRSTAAGRSSSIPARPNAPPPSPQARSRPATSSSPTPASRSPPQRRDPRPARADPVHRRLEPTQTRRW